MKEELITVSVDELKEAEQEMKEFVAEQFTDYAEENIQEISEEHQISEKLMKNMVDCAKHWMQLDDFDLDDFHMACYAMLLEEIKFSVDELCAYIVDPEKFKKDFLITDEYGLLSYRNVNEHGVKDYVNYKCQLDIYRMLQQNPDYDFGL